ncbi:HlyD family secretion protein [Hippea maritima]|uniref:Secretion protein HlyD family protein n=1 Tax=Hippea maritima (strain ATCC 700847 / DSM 10411 / MH2) TaxID=760142 RepID=F2LY68_HIPMA|nr:HlyD family secretion protein [Hippea maritima]AEA34391.1 secretion protein HlyD family protein [Hippea maritima DSM 10411]
MEKEKIKNGVSKKFILIFILVVFGLAVFLFIQYKRTHISTDDAYITNDIYWVNPRVSGTILRVFIDDNQYVKKGQVLAVIDPKPFEIALKAAKANVELAKARLSQAKTAIPLVEAEIELYSSKFKKAQWDYQRAERLFKLKVIPKDKYEYYLTNYNVIKASLKAENEKLNQAKAEYKSAQKDLDAAKASLENAKLNLSYTKIKAPYDGFITKKSVETGKFVSPQIPICAIVPDKGAWIVANYKESQIEKMRKGMKVVIEIDAYPGKKFEGFLDSIQYGTGEVFSLFPPQNASGNWIKVTQRIPVKILFKKRPNVPLRVGMSAYTTVLVK